MTPNADNGHYVTLRCPRCTRVTKVLREYQWNWFCWNDHNPELMVVPQAVERRNPRGLCTKSTGS